MITKREWDIIARCLHNHPPSISTEEVDALIQKLAQLTDCEKQQACIDK
tara:strand:+ start:13 stop:159 length:147 start_codon:yes stop_codon:yes gene_type:complete